MKAISLRQPWADLVVQGKKTLELRTWTVSHRGPLAIHAAQAVEEAACQAHGLAPGGLTSGALVGVVDLVEIIPLDEAAFQQQAGAHRAQGFFAPPPGGVVLYGWRLENPRPLPHPIPYRGRMGLFSVPDALLDEGRGSAGGEPAAAAEPALAADWDARQPFELRVVPETHQAQETPGRAAYRLALYQRIVEPPPAQGRLTTAAPIEMRLVVELGGAALKAVSDQVLEALRGNGYAATELSPGRRQPFLLAEESGVRLGLLFLAARPVSRLERIEAISAGIRAMTAEELYYWFSKCAAPGSGRAPACERAQKALRILLSSE